MTPTTAAEKIFKSISDFLYEMEIAQYRASIEWFDQWASSPSGSRLVGELGEGWKEDWIRMIQAQIDKLAEVEGELIECNQLFQNSSVSLKFKNGNRYWLSINKQSAVTLDLPLSEPTKP